MQIELTVQVNLPDVEEQDGRVYSIDYSEEDIVDSVADLDCTFTLEEEKLDAQIVGIAVNDRTLWSL